MQLENIYTIKEEVYLSMINFCKQGLPLEVCGLISGPENFGATLWALENPTNSHSRFSISEQTIASVMEQVEKKGEKITGVFHSHPTTAAYPSRSDIRNNPNSNLAYLIVSFKRSQPTVGCFKIINREKVVQLKLNIK